MQLCNFFVLIFKKVTTFGVSSKPLQGELSWPSLLSGVSYESSRLSPRLCCVFDASCRSLESRSRWLHHPHLRCCSPHHRYRLDWPVCQRSRWVPCLLRSVTSRWSQVSGLTFSRRGLLFVARGGDFFIDFVHVLSMFCVGLHSCWMLRIVTGIRDFHLPFLINSHEVVFDG